MELSKCHVSREGVLVSVSSISVAQTHRIKKRKEQTMKILSKYKLTDVILLILAIATLVRAISHNNLLWGILSAFLFYFVLDPIV